MTFLMIKINNLHLNIRLAKMQNEVKKHQSANHKAQHQSHDYQEISDVNHVRNSFLKLF